MLGCILDFLLNAKQREREEAAYIRQMNYGENYIYPGFMREDSNGYSSE
jgi:hypothetical protein